MKVLARVALCCLAVAVCRAQVEVPGASDQHGGFGLQDQRGGRLLLMPNLLRPESLKTALCSGGRRVPIQFERRQVARESGNGRQTSAHFDEFAGNVFTVVAGTVDPDATCFLASETSLAGSAVWSSVAPVGSGACVGRNRFAQIRSRPVTHCWPLAHMGTDKEAALLEFERRGTDALASLVVVDGNRTMFADYTAEFRREGDDLWRVDDGGVLSPQGIEIVCVLQRRNWYALATAWAGAEGRLLQLWISDGNERFTKVLNDYWYQAPI